MNWLNAGILPPRIEGKSLLQPDLGLFLQYSLQPLYKAS